MIKLLITLLTLSITNIFNLNQGIYQVMMISDNSYIESYIVTDHFKIDEIVDESNNEKKYLVTKDNKEIEIDALNLCSEELNGYLYVFYYYNEWLNLLTINSEMEIVSNEELDHELNVKKIFSSKNSKLAIFTYTNDQNDIKCFSAGDRSNQFSFGGELVDEVKGIYCCDDCFYMVILKDGLSGGDFGYGGHDKAIVLAKINYYNEVENYVTIDMNKENIQIDWVNDYLYLQIENTMYLFTEDLKLLNSFNYEEHKNIIIGQNGLIVCFYNDRINIYDSYNFSLLKVINETLGSDVIIKKFDDFLYLINNDKGYILDIISFIQVNSYYDLDGVRVNNYNEVYSLFGKCELSSEAYMDYFDGYSYGDYDLELEYKTPHNDYFILTKEELINLKINVKEGMTYKAGYRLQFNGIANLDGINIVNNYPVNAVGNHTLVIKGNGVEQIIHFKVTNNQLPFIDEVQELGDYQVHVNQSLKLKYKVSGLKTEDISEIVTKSCDIESYMIANNELVITLKPFKVSEQKTIFIEKIIYKEYLDKNKEEEIERTLFINKEYKVNVYKDYPTISLVNISDDLSFEFEVIDTEQTIRELHIVLENESTNYDFYYSLENGSLNINNIQNGLYHCYIKLDCNVGKQNYESLLLYECDIKTSNSLFSFGELIINKYTEYLNKFTIKLNEETFKTMLTKLNVNNNEMSFEKVEDNDTIIIYSTISFIGSLAVGVLIRYIIKKKKVLSQ